MKTLVEHFVEVEREFGLYLGPKERLLCASGVTHALQQIAQASQRSGELNWVELTALIMALSQDAMSVRREVERGVAMSDG